MATKYKTQQKQRVALNTMVDPEIKSALDEEKDIKKVSLAHLIDQILRQYFEEANDGTNTVTTR
jgi:hypothetical protein